MVRRRILMTYFKRYVERKTVIIVRVVAIYLRGRNVSSSIKLRIQYTGAKTLFTNLPKIPMPIVVRGVSGNAVPPATTCCATAPLMQ
jgi:hypothetical protein